MVKKRAWQANSFYLQIKLIKLIIWSSLLKGKFIKKVQLNFLDSTISSTLVVALSVSCI